MEIDVEQSAARCGPELRGGRHVLARSAFDCTQPRILSRPESATVGVDLIDDVRSDGPLQYHIALSVPLTKRERLGGGKQARGELLLQDPYGIASVDPEPAETAEVR